MMTFHLVRVMIAPPLLLTLLLGHTRMAAAQAAAYAPTYLDPIDLGTLGGNETRAHAENNGRIVGASQTTDGTVHAFKYEQGNMLDLGTLGGSTSWAFAINAVGAVAGSASLPDDVAVHAFLWTGADRMVDLGTLGGTFSRASGIDDAGQVAGWSQIAGDFSFHAFVWDSTNGMRDLGTLGGDASAAYDVAGVACGEAQTSVGERHAFVTTSDALRDLGTIGGTYSAAINCSDRIRRRIVGESSVNGDGASHAVWWDDRFNINDIGSLGGTVSRALRVSDNGEILGESETGDGDTHPFQWWRTRLADYNRVLGADSRIESVVPAGGFQGYTILSGAAFGNDIVHAYIGHVPSWSSHDSDAARVISSGVVEARSLSTAHVAFDAQDTTGDLVTATGLGQCHPCAARDTVSLSATRFVTADSTGSATIRGNRYVSVPITQVQLTITAGSFVVPDTGEQWITASGPFTFSGFVLGAKSSDTQEPDKLFGVTLSGTGTLNLQLFSCDGCILPDGRRYYDQRELRYVFEPGPQVLHDASPE